MPKLATLWCYDNASLTGLTLGTHDDLSNLQCYNTGIRGTLDVSGLPKLATLWCYDNASLTGLTLGQHDDLTDLRCSNTGISGTLDVSGFPKLATLLCYDNASLTGLTLGQHDDLTDLQCYKSGISGTLDVSGLSKLQNLWCYDNASLTGLTLGQHDDLTDLRCSNTGISGTLDVSGFPKLRSLDCYDNASLTGLTLGQHDDLTYLRCYNTGISGTLDVSGFPKLATLLCYDNASLTGLTLGQHDDLTDLQCYKSGISGTLDVSGLSKLQNLWCYDNASLTGLTLGTHDDLFNLQCYNTGIRGTLDVSGLPKLATLWCYDNASLTGLTLGTHDDLSNLQCYNTGIRGTLDVSGFPKLETLWCYDNASLTGLTLGQHDDLTYLYCYATGISGTLDVSSLPKLQFLYCHDNASLTGLTLGQHDDLTDLRCNNTGISGTLDVSGLPKLSTLQYDGKAVVLPDGTINTKGGGNMKVQFGLVPTTGGSYEFVPFTLTALPDSGYHFTGWVGLPDSGKSKDNPVSFMPGTGYTYTANFAPNSGGGDSSDDDDDDTPSRNYIITTPQPPKPNNPVLAVIELPVTVGDGTATGKPDNGRTASAIAEAGKKAEAKTNGIAVQYDAKTSKTYGGFSITIKRATLDRLIAAKVKYVTLNTGIVDLTFDLAVLKEIAAKSTGDVTLTAARETGLAGDALAAVGKRPAYRLAVSYTGKDGKAATVSDFGAGRVTVGLAYKPAATEQAGSLYLVYSKDGKGAEWLYQSSYDRTSGNVMASTGHFSVYGVGYKPAPAFTDTVNHWAKADIDFVASRGLLTGTGNTTFTPGGTITRGMFVTALGRLAGVDPAAYPSSRFTDVPATAYYAPYVEWAASKGIVNGTGEKSFSPDAAITREQMALIMQRYADKLGYFLPVAREAEIFADEGQITIGMKDAVRAMQQAGVMNGKDGSRFDPQASATRAEAAAVLRRFVEIVIDPAAAGGWGQNDAGKWLYYEDAKPVTGWKQIESKWYYFDAAGLMQAGGWKQIGGKWYYFYPDGAMAVNTKIDGYEIGPDGKRREN